MRRRLLASIGALAAAIAVASMTATPVAGQTPAAAKARTAAPAKPYTPPRTADGHPDLQGVWDFRNVIPLERPSQYAGKEFLTDQEVAEYEKSAHERLDMDRRDEDPTRTPPVVNGAPATADVARAYNEFWWDYGKKFVGSKRSSLIIDPADGKIPPLTPAAKKRADEIAERRARPAWGPEDRSIGERCLMASTPDRRCCRAPTTATCTVPDADYVAIVTEMVHHAHRPARRTSARECAAVVRKLARPLGGNTLVIETKGFYDQTSFANSGEHASHRKVLARRCRYPHANSR